MIKAILALLFAICLTSIGADKVFKDNNFIKKFCIKCHSQKKEKGKINFEHPLSPDQLISVFETIEKGNMPPEDEPQPTSHLKKEFLELLVKSGSYQKPFRWVMRDEFQQMAKNIFGITFHSSLPQRSLNRFGIPDSSSDFKNINEVYFEKLINDIDRLLAEVYKGQLKENSWVPNKINCNEGKAEIFPLKSSFIISSTNTQNGLQPEWAAPYDGLYEISFLTSAFNVKNNKQKALIVSIPEQENNKKSIKVYDHETKNSLKFRLNKGETFSVYSNMYYKPKKDHHLLPKDRPFYKTGVKIKTFSIRGPIDHQNTPWDNSFKYPIDQVTKNIETILSRVFWKKPLKNQIGSYIKIFNRRFEQTKNLNLAYLEIYKYALSSPDFLMVDDYSNDHESTLRRIHIALNGAGKNTEAIKDLSSALTKNTNFIKTFTDSWLGLSGIDILPLSKSITGHNAPEKILLSMRQETYEYMLNAVKSNINLKDLIKSDYTYLNKELANFYGIKGQFHDKLFTKAAVPGPRGGGILSHASVHVLTGNAEKNTSPIKRGVWVSTRILGIIPPEPPPMNFELKKPNSKKPLSVREVLEQHKSSASCYSCHKLFDGFGLAMESFDNFGRYRKNYFTKSKRSKSKANSIPIETSGQWKKYDFKDLEEAKEIFIKDENFQFIKQTLIMRVYEFTMQRSLTLEEIINIKKNIDNYSDNFRNLLVHIFENDIFKQNIIH